MNQVSQTKALIDFGILQRDLQNANGSVHGMNLVDRFS